METKKYTVPGAVKKQYKYAVPGAVKNSIKHMLFGIAKIPPVLECTKVWNRIRNKTFLAIMQMEE